MTAEAPDDLRYFTTAEVASRFRTAPSSVREWHRRGYGPKAAKFGKNLLWPVSEVERWEQEQLQKNDR